LSIFVLVVAVALALLSLLLYRRLAVAPRWPDAVRRGVALTLALGWVALLLAFAMQSGVIDPRPARWVAWAGMTWLALAWYLLLGSVVLGIGALALRRAHRPQARLRLLRFGTPVVVVAALATTGYGVSEAATPSVNVAMLTSPRVPEGLDRLRIALVTDLHVGPVRDRAFTQSVVDRVNEAHPDIVLLGGDLVDGKVEQVADAIAPIAGLEAPLGVYAVSGNHEFISGEADAWMRQWGTLGVTVLRNRGTVVARDGSELHLAGVNDLTATGADATDVDAALAGTTADDFTILLAHQPLTAERVQGRGVDLQLSGHTHGGQLWPFRYFVPLQQPMVDGAGLVGDVPVFTSRGAGAWGPPERVLAPPEIPVITLRNGERQVLERLD
jgi:predicted MPP superfamily phosphohydrolase